MAEKDTQLEPLRDQIVQTYVLTPIGDSPRSEEPLIDLRSLVRALWQWKLVIVIVPVALAALVYGYRKFGNNQYVATATMLIQRSTLENEMEPQSLSLETYQELATADSVVEKLRNRLVEEGVISNEMTAERLARQIEPQLVAAKEVDRAGQRSYLPMVQLKATSSRPEASQAIANTWAELFESEARELGQLRKKDALEFVETRYPDAAQTLEQYEEELNSTRDDYSEQVLTTQAHWEQQLREAHVERARKVGAFRAEKERSESQFLIDTQRLKTEHTLKTEDLKRDFLKKWQRDIKADERSVNRKKLSELKDRLLDVDVRIKTLTENLNQLETEIKKHPEFIVLAKAISDDALWQKIGSQASDLRQLAGVKFESQDLNPVYQHLLGELTRVKVELNTLIPTSIKLKEGAAQLERELIDLESEFLTQDAAFRALVTERAADFDQLERQRQVEYQVLVLENEEKLNELMATEEDRINRLQRERDAEIEGLHLDGELSVAQVTRKTDNAKQTYQLLAGKLEAARLARSDELAGVQLGIPAARPGEPQPKQALLWGLAGFVLGLCLVVSFVIMFEIVKPLLSLSESPRSGSDTRMSRQIRESPGAVEGSPKLGHGLMKN